MKKILVILMTAVMCLQMTGCEKGDTEGGGDSAGKENTYLSEAVAFPEYTQIMAEMTAGNSLYYYAISDGGDSAIYQMNMEEETPQPVAIPYAMAKQEYVLAMSVDADGELHIITGLYEGTDANLVLKDMFWKKIDTSGQVLSEYPIIDCFKEQENIYTSGFAVDSAENAFISMGNQVYVLNKNGELLFEATGNGYISKMCRSKDGKVYIIQFGDAGLEMYEVDVQAGGLGTRNDISQLGSSVNAATGIDSDLLLASESAVFEYDIKQKNFTQKFEWQSVDVVADWYGSMLALEDGRILWLGKEYQDNTMKTDLTVIRLLKEGEQVQSAKKVLTFGGVSIFIDSPVRKAITDFNKSNQDYRIEIKEYGAEDISTGLIQLNADIVSGNCPDILALPLRFSKDLYARKGVLTDLYPYIEKDTSCERSDFQENILKIYETDDKLYAIPISYDIYTVLGKSSLLGERNSWTLEEMIAFVDDCPKDSEIFNDGSKSRVLSTCMRANWDQMVNWNDDDENAFNRELFIKMLQFANRFIDDDKYTYDDNLPQRIQDDQVQLLETNVSGISSNQFFCALFGGQVTYAGYPAENGNGSLVGSTSAMAISAKCDYQDIAWEFINSMLSEEFQAQTAIYNFPIRKSGLEKQIERAMEVTYYTDENGNQKEESKGMSGMGDFTVATYADKDTDVQAIRQLIESADKLRTGDDQISNIITEEAQVFFSGNKTAEEAADIVENRIRIYVSEMK